MSHARTVAMVAGTLGLGGTEKGMVTHALRLDRTRFSPKVIALYEEGPRRADLEAGGVEVGCAQGNLERLIELLDGADLVHVFRHGGHDPLLPEACRQTGVRILVESNIFGAVDRSPDESLIACHLFLSLMCLRRYREWVGSPEPFGERHRVSYLPVDADRLRTLAPDTRTAKLALGFDPDRPLVGRLGRAADLKWRDLLIDMAPHLIDLVPDVQILYVGMTPSKQRRAGRLALLEQIRAHPAVADEERLAGLYRACDVVINGAVIGESQGVALAEAMALEVPVVTCSTPWADNAQVEMVDHGVTGWVANHPKPFAEAVADLVHNPERRRVFGRAAAAKVDTLLNPDRLTRQLESLYDHHLGGGTGSLPWSPDEETVARFDAEYPALAARQFRPLSGREQLEAGLERRRDRARQLTASARMVATSMAQTARAKAAAHGRR
jgi:glycosyltransferase involved in cell wall biosynthesis